MPVSHRAFESACKGEERNCVEVVSAYVSENAPYENVKDQFERSPLIMAFDKLLWNPFWSFSVIEVLLKNKFFNENSSLDQSVAGLCYLNGIGCEANPETAVIWHMTALYDHKQKGQIYPKASEVLRNFIDSVCGYACNPTQRVVECNDVTVFEVLKIVAGYEAESYAKHALAQCYINGIGVPKNPEMGQRMIQDLGSENVSELRVLSKSDGDGSRKPLRVIDAPVLAEGNLGRSFSNRQ